MRVEMCVFCQPCVKTEARGGEVREVGGSHDAQITCTQTVGSLGPGSKLWTASL